MKNKYHLFLLGVLLAAGILFISAQVFAETVEISTAQTSMQDLEAIAGGALPKTALVTPTGSVVVSSETDSAIWAKTDGWTVTISPGRTVQSGKMGVNFNDAKDASGNDKTGILVNGGNISASGTTNYVFGVNTGSGSTITNQSGATILGSTTGNYGLGIYADSNATITNWGSISGIAGASGSSYGIWANTGNANITNKTGGAISASSLGSGNYGVRAYVGSTVTNETGAIITANGTSSSAGIYTGNNNTVTNAGTITGIGTTGTGYGIYTGTNSIVTNTGNITGNGFLSGYGISTGSGSTITNETGATITASGGNAAAGINMNTGSTVVNNGIITVNGGGPINSGITGTNPTITNNGTITVNGNLAIGLNMISSGTAVNNGTISVTGSTGVDGVHIDGSGTFTNLATGAITSTGYGVTFRSVSGGAGIVTNYGTITGVVGVRSTAGNATIDNYGTIEGTGGTAIQLDGDNNTLVLHDFPTVTVTGAIVAGGNNNTLELAGAGNLASDVTGTWALTKSGAGTWTVTGTNTYTGPTAINAGILSVNGSITSPVTVNTSGTLMGIGTISGDVTNSGAIAAGNSIGTLTVNGNLTFASGSVYQVEANAAGESDKIVVSGTTSISSDNTTVSVLAESGTYAASTQYTILTSTGGVTGTFANVTSNLAFLTPSLSYDATNVYLLLTRNTTDFVDVALTRNQIAVASGLDRIATSATGDMATVMTSFLTLSAAGARSAYNQIGGLTHAALAEASSFAFNRYLNTVSDRMGGFGKASPFFAGQMFLASLDNTGSDAVKTVTPERGLWMKGYGGAGDRRDDDISSKYTYRTGGVTAGYDQKIGKNILLGVSGGYTAAKVSMDDLDDTAKVSIYQASFYGSYSAAPWYVNGVIAYGYNRYDTSRDIVFGSINRTADATYAGHAISGYTEAGYNLDIKTVSVTPLAALQASYLTRDAFTEEGAGSLNLEVDKEHSKSLIGSLGVRVKKDYPARHGVITPEVKLRWQHEFLDNDYQIDAAFSGYSSSAFLVKTDEAARDSAVFDLGVAWAVQDNLDLAAGYEATFSGDRTQHAATLGVKYLW